MNKLALAFLLTIFAAPALAAPHTYQVTGPVIDVNDKEIVVSKGKENWSLARDANTKIPPSVKVGSKVTIEYSMTAIDVTDKTATSSGKSGKKAKTTP